MERESIEIISSNFNNRVAEVCEYAGAKQALQLVLVFPGIRSYDVWSNVLKIKLNGIEGVRCEVVGIAEFSSISFIKDIFLDSHDRHLGEINERVHAAISKHNPQSIVLLGHSYGSFLISRYIERYRNVCISAIICAGSILPVGYHWSRCDLRTTIVINECGQKDVLPIVARAISTRFGQSGRVGFTDMRVRNRWHAEWGHNRFVYFDKANTRQSEAIDLIVSSFIKPFLKESLFVESGKLPLQLTVPENITRYSIIVMAILPMILSRIVRCGQVIWSGRLLR